MNEEPRPIVPDDVRDGDVLVLKNTQLAALPGGWIMVG